MTGSYLLHNDLHYNGLTTDLGLISLVSKSLATIDARKRAGAMRLFRELHCASLFFVSHYSMLLLNTLSMSKDMLHSSLHGKANC